MPSAPSRGTGACPSRRSPFSGTRPTTFRCSPLPGFLSPWATAPRRPRAKRISRLGRTTAAGGPPPSGTSFFRAPARQGASALEPLTRREQGRRAGSLSPRALAVSPPQGGDGFRRSSLVRRGLVDLVDRLGQRLVERWPVHGMFEVLRQRAREARDQAPVGGEPLARVRPRIAARERDHAGDAWM